jgi:hypothetical protein
MVVLLKPQNSIFQRLATTGPKSDSKAQMGIGFCYVLLNLRTAFSNDSMQRG